MLKLKSPWFMSLYSGAKPQPAALEPAVIRCFLRLSKCNGAAELAGQAALRL